MQLTYNTIDLATLGTLRIIGRATQREPVEAPQRERVTYTMRLDFFQQSFQSNWNQIQQFMSALSTQNVNLTWQDDNGATYENRTVTAGSDEVPQDIMSRGGTYWQGITFSFWFYNHNIISNCLNATCFGLDLGAVATWREGVRETRFDDLHPQRRRVEGVMTASGRWQADTTQPLAARQQALMALKDAMMATLLANAQGTLQFGTFNQTVRIESFVPAVNQPMNYIDWTLSVIYTAYPNEADYALIDLKVKTRLAKPENITYLTLSGTIAGPSASACTTRLGLLTGSLVPAGYANTVTETTPATVVSESDAVANGYSSGDGTAFVSMAFNYEYRDSSGVATCTYQRSVTNAPNLNLGTVDQFAVRYQTTLFDEMRNQRKRDAGQVTIGGKWFVSDSLTAAQQQAALTSQLAQLQTELKKGSSGTLVYGTVFNQVVRIVDFDPKINRFSNCIVWTLTANYTVFPNEADYALCEFKLGTRNNLTDGTIFKTISGEIWAPTETAAQSKLARLRSAIIPNNFVMVRDNTTGNTVDVESDLQTTGINSGEGYTFIRLTIDEEWQSTASGNLLQWSLKITTDTDVKTPFTKTTYSGTVVATAADQPTAFAAAAAQAQALGGNQEAFLLRSVVAENERLFQTAGAKVFVTVDFSYEYQTAGNTIYLEVSSVLDNNNFGETIQTVTGYIAAPSLSAAQAAYAVNVRNVALNGGGLILSERTPNASYQELQDNSGNELASLDDKLTFSLQILMPKSTDNTSIEYTLTTSANIQTLEVATVVEGTIYASNETVARAFLSSFLPTQTLPGALTSSNAVPEYKQAAGVSGSGTQSVFVSLKFRNVYVSIYSGFAGILESEVVQDIQYSGTRNVVKGIPVGTSIVQQVGTVEARNIVTARCVATTGAAAQAWIRTIRKGLLYSAQTGTGVQAYEEPPRVKTNFTFLPQVAGVVSGTGINVKLYEVSGNFSEIIPDYGFTG